MNHLLSVFISRFCNITNAYYLHKLRTFSTRLSYINTPCIDHTHSLCLPLCASPLPCSPKSTSHSIAIPWYSFSQTAINPYVGQNVWAHFQILKTHPTLQDWNPHQSLVCPKLRTWNPTNCHLEISTLESSAPMRAYISLPPAQFFAASHPGRGSYILVSFSINLLYEVCCAVWLYCIPWLLTAWKPFSSELQHFHWGNPSLRVIMLTPSIEAKDSLSSLSLPSTPSALLCLSSFLLYWVLNPGYHASCRRAVPKSCILGCTDFSVRLLCIHTGLLFSYEIRISQKIFCLIAKRSYLIYNNIN